MAAKRATKNARGAPPSRPASSRSAALFAVYEAMAGALREMRPRRPGDDDALDLIWASLRYLSGADEPELAEFAKTLASTANVTREAIALAHEAIHGSLPGAEVSGARVDARGVRCEGSCRRNMGRCRPRDPPRLRSADSARRRALATHARALRGAQTGADPRGSTHDDADSRVAIPRRAAREKAANQKSSLSTFRP